MYSVAGNIAISNQPAGHPQANLRCGDKHLYQGLDRASHYVRNMSIYLFRGWHRGQSSGWWLVAGLVAPQVVAGEDPPEHGLESLPGFDVRQIHYVLTCNTYLCGYVDVQLQK